MANQQEWHGAIRVRTSPENQDKAAAPYLRRGRVLLGLLGGSPRKVEVQQDGAIITVLDRFKGEKLIHVTLPVTEIEEGCTGCCNFLMENSDETIIVSIEGIVNRDVDFVAGNHVWTTDTLCITMSGVPANLLPQADRLGYAVYHRGKAILTFTDRVAGVSNNIIVLRDEGVDTFLFEGDQVIMEYTHDEDTPPYFDVWEFDRSSLLARLVYRPRWIASNLYGSDILTMTDGEDGAEVVSTPNTIPGTFLTSHEMINENDIVQVDCSRDETGESGDKYSASVFTTDQQIIVGHEMSNKVIATITSGFDISSRATLATESSESSTPDLFCKSVTCTSIPANPADFNWDGLPTCDKEEPIPQTSYTITQAQWEYLGVTVLSCEGFLDSMLQEALIARPEKASCTNSWLVIMCYRPLINGVTDLQNFPMGTLEGVGRFDCIEWEDICVEPSSSSSLFDYKIKLSWSGHVKVELGANEAEPQATTLLVEQQILVTDVSMKASYSDGILQSVDHRLKAYANELNGGPVDDDYYVFNRALLEYATEQEQIKFPFEFIASDLYFFSQRNKATLLLEHTPGVDTVKVRDVSGETTLHEDDTAEYNLFSKLLDGADGLMPDSIEDELYCTATQDHVLSTLPGAQYMTGFNMAKLEATDLYPVGIL